MISDMVLEVERRFWEKVDRRGPDDCWPWTAGCNSDGYGHARNSSRRPDLAHRVSYDLSKGTIPEGLFVLHTCDNPPCVNPAHLFLGTHLDNMRDRGEKGRSARREYHGRAKLTEEQVQEIRRDYVRRSRTHGLRALSRKYGVGLSTVGHIVNRYSWK